VKIQVKVFWVMTTCSVGARYQHYTVSQPKSHWLEWHM